MSGVRGLLARLSAAFLALVAAGAQAGGPLGICDDAARTVLAYSPAAVNLNYDRGSLGALTKLQADAIVENAVKLWTDVGTATIVVGRGDDLPEDVTVHNYESYLFNAIDGFNPVIYDTDGSIIDDFFGAGQKRSVLGFAGSGGMDCRYTNGQAVINGFIDVSDTTLGITLAHEIGHLIGLDHTQLDGIQGLAQGTYPLMYPFIDRDVLTLHEDDVTAVTALYPDASASAVYGELRGFFVLANGATPVRGANLWATETTTKKVYSIVSDYRMQNTGFFRLLLPPGNYNLRAEAIYSGFDQGSSVGPYAELFPTSPSFQPPLYVGDQPMPTLTLGNGSPLSIPIAAGCAATVTFRFDGTGSVAACALPPPPPPPPQPVFRAYLKSTGHDANPCSLAAPCRLLPAALAAVVDGGEVWMLDSGNYNAVPVDITKSVTILAVPGHTGSLAGLNGRALAINAPGIDVTLQNLTIFSFGNTGDTGVLVSNAANVSIINCTIFGFKGLNSGAADDGIGIRADTGTNFTKVNVVESVVRNNSIGILAAGNSRVTISKTHVLANSGTGIMSRSLTGGFSVVEVSDSVSSANSHGFMADGCAGACRAHMFVKRSTASENTVDGFTTRGGTGAVMVVDDSMATHNLVGFNNTGGTFQSRGNNTVAGNTTAQTNGAITLQSGR